MISLFSAPLRHRSFPLLLFILFLNGSCVGSGCGEHPKRSAVPNLNYRTGEEILFIADDFADLSSIADPLHARYIWDFGDLAAPPAEARSATYTYLNPGTYTVRLEVTPATLLSNNGTPNNSDDDSWEFRAADIRTYTGTCTILGAQRPLIPQVTWPTLLSFAFDGSLDASGLSGLQSDIRGETPVYVTGQSGSAVDLGGNSALVIDSATLLGGRSEFTVSFRARRNTLAPDNDTRNCLLWQGTANTWQPAVRILITDAIAGATYKEGFTGYVMGNASSKPAAYTLSRDLLWHHYACTYSASSGAMILYRDGLEVSRATASGAVAAPTTPLYIGYGMEQTNDGIVEYGFDGAVDDLRIYDRVLSPAELATAFTVRHADFHGRIAQQIGVTIPEQLRLDPTNRLRAIISGGALQEPLTLTDHAGLAAMESFLLRTADLEGSTDEYRLTVALVSGAGQTLYSQDEYFKKSYDGVPQVGIDENNAVCINGIPYFPVTPWGLNDIQINEWIGDGYINSLYGQGFSPEIATPDGYGTYLDLAQAAGCTVIGPATFWEGRGNLVNYGKPKYDFVRSTDTKGIRAYVERFRTHPAVQMWQWLDEPELRGATSQSVRSWIRLTHDLDPQHLTAINFMGHPYGYNNGPGSYRYNERHTYALGWNRELFGAHRAVADVVGVDYYPLDAAHSGITDTMHRLGTILDTIREENLDMLPVFSYVETADAGNVGATVDRPHLTPWKPSAQQLKMITWFNVVHEVKGINWFHYFSGGETFATSAECFAFMKEFTTDITALTPVVLGPRTTRSVSVSASGGGRVDTMLRQYDGRWYLIAVRVSEFAQQAASLRTTPPPAQNYDITATFSLGGDFTPTTATVRGESRTVPVSSGQFSDSFAPYAVHIYVLE